MFRWVVYYEINGRGYIMDCAESYTIAVNVAKLKIRAGATNVRINVNYEERTETNA